MQRFLELVRVGIVSVSVAIGFVLVLDAGAAHAATLWAIVDEDATLVRGKNVERVGTVAGGSGWYEVIFKKDVSRCAWVATIGISTSGHPPFGLIAVAARNNNPRGVFVVTTDSEGFDKALPFHLKVFC